MITRSPLDILTCPLTCPQRAESGGSLHGAGRPATCGSTVMAQHPEAQRRFFFPAEFGSRGALLDQGVAKYIYNPVPAASQMAELKAHDGARLVRSMQRAYCSEVAVTGGFRYEAVMQKPRYACASARRAHHIFIA